MRKVLLILGVLILLTNFSFGILMRSEKYVKIKREMLKRAGNLESEFIREYKSYSRTGLKSKRLRQMLRSTKTNTQMLRMEIGELSENHLNALCLGCRFALGALLNFRRLGLNKRLFRNLAINLCTEYIQPKEVCKGAVDLNLDSIFYIVDNNKNITSNYACAIIIQNECGEVPEEFGFSIKIDKSSDPKSSRSVQAQKHQNIEKILQISDIHYDPNYLINGSANCPAAVCCRNARESTNSSDDGAGYWGDYRNCDLPWHSVENAIEQASQHARENGVKLVYFTGDIIDHVIWSTTPEYNMNVMDKVYDFLKEKFKGMTFLPVIGNHETSPVNVMAPSNITECPISTHWLYEYLHLKYSDWLPANALETVRQGGYYTVLVRPGFRVIALNNNICYSFNWWILYEQDNMIQQLQWLHDILLEAEKANERVHILAHIPLNENSCYKYWTREYGKIVSRFRDTISAQFNGHTHKDEFHLFYDTEDEGVPINVAWNGGSLTTFSNVNPNYKVYYIDKTSLQVTDFESWIFNLSAANSINELNSYKNPEWYKLYSFKNDFDLQDLDLRSLDKLVFDMVMNSTLLRQYWKYKVKAGDPYMLKGCDKTCAKSLICGIVTDSQTCKNLVEILNSTYV